MGDGGTSVLRQRLTGGLVAVTVLTTALVVTTGLLERAGAVTAPTAGTVNTLAGGTGTTTDATAVALMPTSVALTGAAPFTAIIADTANHVVRRVDLATGSTQVIAGNGTMSPVAFYDLSPMEEVDATDVSLPYPGGVAVASGGKVLIAVPLLARVVAVDASGELTTVAGSGAPGFGGDGGPPEQASLSLPSSVAVAPNGDVIIADTGNHRIRKVSGGTITTIAGTGEPGYGGDGAAATAAKLNNPSAVAVALNGDVIIADTGNHRVRKVSGGIITSIAGTGVAGYAGDGGPAPAAMLSGPRGVSVDNSGAVIIADTGNQRVRRISGGTITSIAGTGVAGYTGDGAAATAAQLNGPTAVATAGSRIIVADLLNYRVRSLTVGGSISTVAGNGWPTYSGDGGAAVDAQLNAPLAVAADGAGNVYVADTGNHRVRRIDPGGNVTTVAGTGIAGFSGDGGAAAAAQLSYPGGVAVNSSGELFIADTGNNRIRKVAGGTITTIAGDGSAGASGDGGPASAARLHQPAGLAIRGADLFIADRSNNKIRRISGGTITTVAGTGAYGYAGDGGPALVADLAGPVAVAADSAGNVLIADTEANRVRRVGTNGIITTVAGNLTGGYLATLEPGARVPALEAGVFQPRGLAIFGTSVFISDGTNRVLRLEGGMVSLAAGKANVPPGFGGDGWLATQAQLFRPAGLAVDANGTLFVADSANHRVRSVSPVGPDGFGFHSLSPQRILDSRNGTGGFNTPWGPCTSRRLRVAGANGVPAGATAVVLNLTVTNPTAPSHVSVTPAGDDGYYYYYVGMSIEAPPTTVTPGGPACYTPGSASSSINFGPGQTIANQVIARVGDEGEIELYNNSGSVDLIADVVGWYDSGNEGGDRYTALSPSRIADSRTGQGIPTALGPGASRDVQVTGLAGVPAGARAVVVNVTVTQPTAGSHLTLWPQGESMPLASTINFGPGRTIANLAVVKLGPTGKLSVFNAAGSTHVILDVMGYFDGAPAGTRFVPLSPRRQLDTRYSGVWGTPDPLRPGEHRRVQLASPPGAAGAPGTTAYYGLLPSDAKAVALNVTVTGPTASGYLTLFPTGTALPTASNINFTAGLTIANSDVVKLGTGGNITIFNPYGTTHVIIDVVGYYR